MDSTQHFLRLAERQLRDLTALIEEAAGILDQRGSRPLRKKMLQALNCLLIDVRATDTGVNDPGCDMPSRAYLRPEISKVHALLAVRAPKRESQTACHVRRSSGLRIVGGTDMGAAGAPRALALVNGGGDAA